MGSSASPTARMPGGAYVIRNIDEGVPMQQQQQQHPAQRRAPRNGHQQGGRAARRPRESCCTCPNLCDCFYRLPVLLIVILLGYLAHKFSEPAEKMMNAGADIGGAAARVANASANAAVKMSEASLKLFDVAARGVRVMDSGGDAKSMQIGPLSRNEVQNFSMNLPFHASLPEEIMAALRESINEALLGKESSATRAINSYKSEAGYKGIAGKASTYRFEWRKAERYMISAAYKHLNLQLEWSFPLYNYIFKKPTVMELGVEQRVESFVDITLFNKLNSVFWEQHRQLNDLHSDWEKKMEERNKAWEVDYSPAPSRAIDP